MSGSVFRYMSRHSLKTVELFSLLKKVLTCNPVCFKILEAAISGELFQVYEVNFEDMFGGKTDSDLVIAFFRLLI